MELFGRPLNSPLLPPLSLEGSALLVWCGVLAWLWLAACALRLRAEPWAPGAPGRLAAAVLGAIVVMGWVPHGPIDPNHHGVHQWAAAAAAHHDDFLTDAKHGGAHTWLWAMAAHAGLPERWLVLPAAVVAAGAALALGAAVGARVGPRAGVWATALLALWPPHLRVTAGLSGVVVAELGAALILLGVVRRGAGGPATWTGVAVGGGLLAACARAEWMALGPSWLLVVWLCAGRRPTRDDALAAALPAAALAVRAWIALDPRSATIVSTPAWNLAAPLQALGAAVVVTAGGVWLVRRRAAPPPAGAVALLGLLGLTAAAWPPAFRGDFHPWPPGLDALLRTHAWFHPELTSAWWSTLSAVGLVAGLRRAPWRTSLVAAWVLANIAVHAVLVTYDGASTYLRAAPAAGIALCGAAALAADLLAPAGARGAALFAAGTALGVAATWGFTTYRWPDADEYGLLVQAREARGDRVVVSLLRSDPPGDAPDLATHDRLFVEVGLHADVKAAGAQPPPQPWLRGVEQALADPDAVVGGLWLKTLACYRVVPDASPMLQLRVFAGDRLWAVDRRGPRTPPPPPAQPPTFTVDDAPCWDQPHLGTGPDALGLWRCPADVAPSGRPYVDPRCAAMEATFDLEPVRELVTGTGNLSGARLHVDHPAPRIGLYRITGRHSP